MASKITSLTIVYSIVYSGGDQRQHQSSASLALVQRIHRGPHKGPVTRKMFPFDDIIMCDDYRAKLKFKIAGTGSQIPAAENTDLTDLALEA